MTKKLPSRSQLQLEETWDLNLLFASQELYEQELEKLKDIVDDFKNRYKGHLSDSSTIIQALDMYEEIHRAMSPLVLFGFLGYEVDKYNENYEKNALGLDRHLDWMNQRLSFFQTELSGVSDQVIQEVLDTSEGAKYQHFINEIIRLKPRMLAPEIEEVLSGLRSSLYSAQQIYGALKFQDLSFADFQAHGEHYANSFSGFEGDYEGHPDQEVRRAAWESFHQGLAKYQHTAATNYINQVQTEKHMADLRGFDSVFEYLLFNQNFSVTAYHQVIDTIMTELAPVMRRYADMMKKEHQIEDLSLADIKMPLVKTGKKEISIEESRQLIEPALSVLGEEYLDLVKRAFDQRWIDFPMNESKSTGGFCASSYQGPSYILLNWTGLLSEVLVLAHELGHAGHSYFANKHQLVITPDTSLSFIEAPSTANEVIMCQYLLNQDIDQQSKRSLVAEFIARTYYHNFVTHLLEADFQRKVYQAVDRGEILNAHKLNTFFRETLEAFWGDSLIINEGAELTWMRQPHYFSGLYPYTYSVGLTVGTKIGQEIANGDQKAIDAWLEVLKTGGSKTPLELAAMAGVSLETNQSIIEAINFVDYLLDQLETLKD